eukprot:5110548-Pyramimonas_sp.AAC.1
MGGLSRPMGPRISVGTSCSHPFRDHRDVDEIAIRILLARVFSWRWQCGRGWLQPRAARTGRFKPPGRAQHRPLMRARARFLCRARGAAPWRIATVIRCSTLLA